jgi:hypothetical protein
MNSLVNFKLGKLPKRRFMIHTAFWLFVLTSLILAQPIYTYLFSNQLTATEPLSLFDVIQITGIVALLYASSRARAKLDALERRVQDLHQELSIRLAEKD